ncbi:MAG: hypothetical protein HY553_14915 [Elusimicrobia bacterium]|nr:hypothetical protein [Elusimicrobiota bacterium]
MIDENAGATREKRERRGAGLWAWFRTAFGRVLAPGRWEAVARPAAAEGTNALGRMLAGGAAAKLAGGRAAVVAVSGTLVLVGSERRALLPRGDGDFNFMGDLSRLTSQRYRELTQGEGIPNARPGGRILIAKEPREAAAAKRGEDAKLAEEKKAGEQAPERQEARETPGDANPFAALGNLGALPKTAPESAAGDSKQQRLSFYGGSGGATSGALLASAGPAALRDAAGGLRAATPAAGGADRGSASRLGRVGRLTGRAVRMASGGSSGHSAGPGQSALSQLAAARTASVQGAGAPHGDFAASVAGRNFDGGALGPETKRTGGGSGADSGSGGAANLADEDDSRDGADGAGEGDGTSTDTNTGTGAGTGGNPLDDQNIHVPTTDRTKNVTPYQHYVDKARDAMNEGHWKQWLGKRLVFFGVTLAAVAAALLAAVAWWDVTMVTKAQAAWLLAASAAATGLGSYLWWNGSSNLDEAQANADLIAQKYQQETQARILSDYIHASREGRDGVVDPYSCGYSKDMSSDQLDLFIQCMGDPANRKDERILFEEARQSCLAQQGGEWQLVLSKDELMPYQCRTTPQGTRPCKDESAVLRETQSGYQCVQFDTVHRSTGTASAPVTPEPEREPRWDERIHENARPFSE